MVKTERDKLDYSKVVINTAANLGYNFDAITFQFLRNVLLCNKVAIDNACKELLTRGTVQDELEVYQDYVVPKLAFNIIKAWAIIKSQENNDNNNNDNDDDGRLKKLVKCIVRLFKYEEKLDNKSVEMFSLVCFYLRTFFSAEENMLEFTEFFRDYSWCRDRESLVYFSKVPGYSRFLDVDVDDVKDVENIDNLAIENSINKFAFVHFNGSVKG